MKEVVKMFRDSMLDDGLTGGTVTFNLNETELCHVELFESHDEFYVEKHTYSRTVEYFAYSNDDEFKGSGSTIDEAKNNLINEMLRLME